MAVHHIYHDHGHTHGDQPADHGHGHTHGTIDAALFSTQQGLDAIKWSALILFVTALVQIGIVFLTESVALLADSIHNIGDAATALPLGVAFTLGRKPPNNRFSYGYGRVEDLAGIGIVAIMFFSGLLVAYESLDRLLHPQQVYFIWAVIAAAGIGFIGNETVALCRIKVVKKSAAPLLWRMGITRESMGTSA